MARYIVQMRRGGKTQWEESNIIPLAGEIVVEIDEINNLHKLKIGDGIHTYSELAYLQAGDELVTQILTKALPRVITVTLDKDKWEEVTCETNPNLGYYGQVIEIEGITEYSRLDLQPNADILAEFQDLNLVFVTENNGGTITVYSVGDLPLNTYTIQATIVETEVSIDDVSVIGTTVGTPTSNVVKYIEQTLTDEQKAQARENIGAIIYNNATTSTAGLMSATDKEKLDNISNNANQYTHPETHPASMITGLANVATSGSYNDLSNKPTIPTIPTKVSAFENDNGYLTSYTETDPTVPNWAKQPNKPSYTPDEVGADAKGAADTALLSAKSYTDTKISDLINSAPTTLDTLGEIAAAMENNEDVVKALDEAIGTKANVSDLNAHLNNKTNPHNDIYYTESEIDAKFDAITLTDATVTLSEQFTITKDFGYYTLGGATSKKVGAVGQTLHSFLQSAFASEDTTVFKTTPSCGISMSGGSYETGTTITPSASWSTSAGEYKWGTYANGAANYSDKTTGITYSNKSTITFDKTGFVLTDGNTKVTASGSANRSAVTKHPCSNLGNDIYDSKLASEYKSTKTLSPTKSVTFTGYRNFFYGAVTVDPTKTNLTSAVIRGLTPGGNYDSAKSFTIAANGISTYKAFIVAIPTSNTRGRISKVESTAGMTVDMTASYKTKASFTVDVADARGGSNNAVSYDLYIWNPASIDGGTIHKFALA